MCSVRKIVAHVAPTYVAARVAMIKFATDNPTATMRRTDMTVTTAEGDVHMFFNCTTPEKLKGMEFAEVHVDERVPLRVAREAWSRVRT